MYHSLALAPEHTPDGATYLAYSPLRQVGECQLVRSIPAVEGDPETRLKCTHITLEQVADRFALVLAGPWWAWGGDAGVNKRGVAVMRAPVKTRDEDPTPALTGMDLVRLALERGRDAEQTLDVLLSLLMTHGQGGDERDFGIHGKADSCFLVADDTGVWEVATSGRHWAVWRLTGATTLMPWPTMGKNYERHSYALPQYAARRGWGPSDEENIDFAAIFGKQLSGQLFMRRRELNNISNQIRNIAGKEPLLGLMHYLRYRRKHLPGRRTGDDRVVHAHQDSRQRQTANALVIRLSEQRQHILATGTAYPDLSIFKPVHFDLPLEKNGVVDLARYQESSLWWRAGRFARHILMRGGLSETYLSERAEFEKDMVLDLLSNRGSDLVKVRSKLLVQILAWEANWHKLSLSPKPNYRPWRRAVRFWRHQNRLDQVSENQDA